MVQIGTISPKPQMNGSPEDPPTCHDVIDKPIRLIIRLLFGFASDSICQTQQNHQQMVRFAMLSLCRPTSWVAMPLGTMWYN